jgi:hypothetical protein
VYYIFRQAGYCVARELADRQYQAAPVQPRATLAEHLEEFEHLWNWMENQWHGELSEIEKEIFATFTTQSERDLFRILKNFARYAAEKNESDFPFPIQHVAARLGVSFQYVSKLRQCFVHGSIIVQTAASMTNRTAARFHWCLSCKATRGKRSATINDG